MAATGPGRDDLCPGRLILDLIDQVRGDLNRKIVFLRECTESPSHSATASVEESSRPSRQPAGETRHVTRLGKSFRMAMSVNDNLNGFLVELERVGFTLEQIVDELLEEKAAPSDGIRTW